jgi:hypothetical protein
MNINTVIDYAKGQGYDGAVYSGKWGEYTVYAPTLEDRKIAYVGMPLVILVRGEEIRMSTDEESLELLDYGNSTMNEYEPFIDFLHAHGFTVGIALVTSTVPATTVDNPSNIEPETVVFEVTRDNKTVIFKQAEFDRLQKLPIDNIEAKFQKHK